MTQGGRDFVVELSPQKDCYELGEVVTLKFRNLAEPSVVLDANFELAQGMGSLVQTSADTATFSSGTTTNSTILVSLVGDEAVFASVDLAVNCNQDFYVQITEGGGEVDPWIMSFTIGDPFGQGDGIRVTVPGEVSDDGERISVSFTAATHFDSKIFDQFELGYQESLTSYHEHLAEFQRGEADHPGRPPNRPKKGDVGVSHFDTAEEYLARCPLENGDYDLSCFLYQVPNFDFTISFEYERIPGPFNIPGVFESYSLILEGEPEVTMVGGPPGEFTLDPVSPASEVVTEEEFSMNLYFVPRN